MVRLNVHQKGQNFALSHMINCLHGLHTVNILLLLNTEAEWISKHPLTVLPVFVYCSYERTEQTTWHYEKRTYR